MANSDITPSTFTFQHHNVRVHAEGEQLWFVARDVCQALGLCWTGRTLSMIPDDWQRMCKLHIRRGMYETRLISEPAVYKLAFRSNKPEADAFTNWVASEVLPTIRKTGRYEATLPAVSAAFALTPFEGTGEFHDIELERVGADFAKWKKGVLASMEALEKDFSRVTSPLYRDVLRKVMAGTPLVLPDMGVWAMHESRDDVVRTIREAIDKWQCIFVKAQWYAKTLRTHW